MMPPSWRRRLQQAFSLERYEEPLTDQESRLLEKIAEAVVRRRLETPALFVLESAKPLNYLGSQAMAFFEPVVRGLFAATDYGRVRRILERRQSVECLLQEIENRAAGENPSSTNDLKGASG